MDEGTVVVLALAAGAVCIGLYIAYSLAGQVPMLI